ncbi:MAG: phosphatidate cytidylyltransferase [Chitinophagaceae bacterium]|nr:MAG: phosphatidate cytidylyltransferase [Chitinophagaceae bacterium]
MNETLTRTLSGAVYIAILVTCSLFSPSFLVLFGIFLLIAVVEYCRLSKLSAGWPIVLSSGLYLGFSLLPISVTVQWSVLLLTLFISVRLFIWLFSLQPGMVDTQAKYVNLIGYVILPMVIISWIPYITGDFQPLQLLCIFVLIWANDTFAFLFGKGFGKRKLFERVSPKKTVEGFIGGWLMALVFSVMVALYLAQEPVFKWMVIATIVSFFGTIGDLIESKFKRSAGVKDSGNIMPGHGGILDRLDSIIFVAPFVFLFYQILPYVS